MNFLSDNDTKRPIWGIQFIIFDTVEMGVAYKVEYVFIIARDNHHKWTRAW